MAVSDPNDSEIFIEDGDIELPDSMKRSKARIDKLKISRPKIVEGVTYKPYFYPEDRTMTLLQTLQRGREALLEVNDEAWFNTKIVADKKKAERLASRKTRK